MSATRPDDRITVSTVLLRDMLTALAGNMDPADEQFLRWQIEDALAAHRQGVTT